MRKVDLEEWIVQFVQAMYKNNLSKVTVDESYTYKKFGVRVLIHQCLAPNGLLFVSKLIALSREFRNRYF